MKIKDFTPELGIWIEIQLNEGMAVRGIIRDIRYFEGRQQWSEFDIEADIQPGFYWTVSIERHGDFDISKVRLTEEHQIYKDEMADSLLANNLCGRKDYIRKLITAGEEKITQEDINDVMEDIDIYNGLCEQRKKHD